MTAKKRLPQATSSPHPELAEFLKPFRVKIYQAVLYLGWSIHNPPNLAASSC